MALYEVEFLNQVREVMTNGHATDRYIEVGVAGKPYLTDSGAENMKISHEYEDEDDTSPEEVVDFHLMEGMVEVLSYRGAFFHGDRVREVAQEWLDAGFFPCKAGEWMDAGVWDSGVARTLKQMGRKPNDLRRVPDDTIYSWCNGDKSVVWPSSMRYRVTIETGMSASEVADTVAYNHGSWESATDGVGGFPGVVFIDANDGEDDDLCAEMDAHEGVIGYCEVEKS